MQAYTLEDFQKALRAVGILRGDTIMVHSALFRLGRLDGVDFKRLPETLAQCLLDYLGPEGTLVVPIYQYEGIDYIKDYRARQMGALSYYISALPQARRTYHTIFSISAVGDLADRIAERDSPAAFDQDGPFEFLVDRGAKALLLGVEPTGVSVVHVAEYRLQVPYRFWMDVPSTRPDKDGNPISVPYRLFMYDLSKYSRIKVEKIDEWIRGDGLVKETALGVGKMSAVGFRDFVTAVEKRLKAAPYCLVE